MVLKGVNVTVHYPIITIKHHSEINGALHTSSPHLSVTLVPVKWSHHTRFVFFAKNNNNILLTRNNIRCSKQRFIFQIQGGNRSNNYIQPKEEEKYWKGGEKKRKKRKTGLRFQREEKVECVCLTDADGDMKPTWDVDGTVHSFRVIYFPYTLLVHSVFVSVGWVVWLYSLNSRKPLFILCVCLVSLCAPDPPPPRGLWDVLIKTAKANVG